MPFSGVSKFTLDRYDFEVLILVLLDALFRELSIYTDMLNIIKS